MQCKKLTYKIMILFFLVVFLFSCKKEECLNCNTYNMLRPGYEPHHEPTLSVCSPGVSVAQQGFSAFGRTAGSQGGHLLSQLAVPATQDHPIASGGLSPGVSDYLGEPQPDTVHKKRRSKLEKAFELGVSLETSERAWRGVAVKPYVKNVNHWKPLAKGLFMMLKSDTQPPQKK